MREWLGKVIENEPRGGGYFVLSLSLPSNFDNAFPGNFVMLSVGCEPSILLRRPMAIYDLIKKNGHTVLKILYFVNGTGTLALSKVMSGQQLSFLGPLGNGFSVPKKDEVYAVIAGGVGIAPFLIWGKSLLKDQKKNMQFYFGFRNNEQANVVQDFKKEKINPLVALDGPGGKWKGTVLDCFSEMIFKQKPDRILTCGPEKMMEAVLNLSKKLGVPCEASLEARMGCGMGVCLSCACTTGEEKNGYSLVCRDGPIFMLSSNGSRQSL